MIPVWINNRNRLTTTKQMVAHLLAMRGVVPIVVDNESSYPPLLEWYSAGCDVEVVFRGSNRGAYGPWEIADLARGASCYVVTDSDLDLSGVPADVIDILWSGLRRFPSVVKAGLSLEINDLPRGTAATRRCIACESRYWSKRLGRRWWSAPVDTTFALYRAGCIRFPGTRPAIRSDRPYTARHIPWYRDLDDEERYVEANCDLRWSSSVKWYRSNEA